MPEMPVLFKSPLLKWFSDEHSESENFSAVFPEIETRVLFFTTYYRISSPIIAYYE